MDNAVVIRPRAGDRRPTSNTIRVVLPQRVTWPTRASVWEWELRVVAEARYTIIAVDTLILNGKAFRSKPCNAMATLPALVSAVAVVPKHDFREILRVRRTELAATPPRPCLRPKISILC